MGSLPQFKNWMSVITADKSFLDPDFEVRSLQEVDRNFLKNNDIKHLIIDLDQTVVIQGTSTIPVENLEHLAKLKQYLGADSICFLTNEHNQEREDNITKATGINVVSGPPKPDEGAYHNALTSLGAQADKRTAMIGDRLYTDILGANKVGITSIKVNPLQSKNDAPGVTFIRKLERMTSASNRLYAFSLIIASAGNMLLALNNLFYYFEDIILNKGLFSSHLNTTMIYLHFLFVCLSLFIFIRTVKINKKWGFAKPLLPFVGYFNTYPAFFRFLFSWLLMAYLGYLYVNDFPVSNNLLNIVFFYSFAVHSALLLSLFSHYHSYWFRFFRVSLDITLVYLISRNLPLELGQYTLMLFLVPIGTATRYLKWGWLTLVIAGCSYISYLIAPVPFIPIYIFLFVLVPILLYVEHKESVSPVERITKNILLHSVGKLSFKDLLSIFSKVANCQGVYYINSSRTGYYHLFDGSTTFNLIYPTANEEIYGALKNNLRYLLSDLQSIDNDSENRQRYLSDALRNVLRPMPVGGMISVIGAKIGGDRDRFIVLVNNLTVNGVARKRFSTRHELSLLLFSAMLNIFEAEPRHK